MSRENISVLYKISGDESVSKYPNVLVISIAAGKEVILLDIMSELPAELGFSFEFWAKRGSSSSYIPLISPTCVVPVVGTMIHLYLERSQARPYIPIGQAFLYSDCSRSNLYDSQSYLSASKQATKITQDQQFFSQRKQVNGDGRFALKKLLRLQSNFAFLESSGEKGTTHSTRSSRTDINSHSNEHVEQFSPKQQQQQVWRQSNDSEEVRVQNTDISTDKNDRSRDREKGGISGATGSRSRTASFPARSDEGNNKGRDSVDINTNRRNINSDNSRGDGGVGSHLGQRDRDRDTSIAGGRSSSGISGSGSALGIAGINTDDIASAATQAAKNIFSFAALSLKTAVEVGQAVVASQSTVLEVGLTKVVIVKELAQGGFGVVYLAQDCPKKGIKDGVIGIEGWGVRDRDREREDDRVKQYALKQILCQSKEQIKEAHDELRFLQMFAGHNNIIRLIDHSSMETQTPKGQHQQRTIRLLFPLFTHGTAWDAIERAAPLERESTGPWPFYEERAMSICRDVARALSFMHSKGFAHRDVKPHNVLISPAEPGLPWGRAVLTDLGSVSPSHMDVRTRQEGLMLEEDAALKSSAAYRAPELTSVRPPVVIDDKVDLWALGCTLFSLAFGRSPFEGPDGVQRLGILNGRFSYPYGNSMRECKYSSTYVQIINDLLRLEPSERPSADSVISRFDSALG